MSQTFGAQLEMFRLTKGLRSKHLAANIGFDPSYITQLERGRRDPPKLPLLAKLVSALGLNASEAAHLARAAAHDRFLRAVANIDIRTNVIDLAEDLVRYDSTLSELDALALRALVKAYVDNKRSTAGAGQIFAILSDVAPAEEGVPM